MTVSPANGGSISAFIRAVLSQYRIETNSTSDSVDALFDLLSGYPFRSYGPRVIFMVDEAQELKPAVLETIRTLWDRGTNARLGLSTGPAFGCMLVGNDLFMGKGGNIRVAGFRPLLTRVTHNIALPRPSQADHAAFASFLFPDVPELQAIVAGFGVDSGNLRAQDVAARQSRLFAGDNPVTSGHPRQAIKMMGQVMTDTDGFLSDHEWRLKMAAEGKAIYVPGKTVEQIEVERMRERERLARKSSRTIALTVEEWHTIDTAIPDIIELLDDVRSVLSGLAYMDDLDRPAVNSMMRLAARAIESTEEKEVRVLDRLDSSIRHEAAREEKERRQAEFAGERK